MANQSISNPIKRSISGGHVATVDDIAYSTKTAGTGALAYEIIDVSLKQKIDEIIQNINDNPESGGSSTSDKIEYQYETSAGKITTTVENILNQLRTGLEGITITQSDIQNASSYASSALSSSQTAEQAKQYITQYIATKTTELNGLKTETTEYLDEVKGKVDNVNSIANQLMLAFDNEADIQIISQSAYDAMPIKKPNTFYFCYDDGTSAEKQTYIITVSPNVESRGYAIIDGQSSNNKTCNFAEVVRIMAVPKRGYKFVKWSNGESYDINPIVNITISQSQDWVAEFESSSSSDTPETPETEGDTGISGFQSSTGTATLNNISVSGSTLTIASKGFDAENGILTL